MRPSFVAVAVAASLSAVMGASRADEPAPPAPSATAVPAPGDKAPPAPDGAPTVAPSEVPPPSGAVVPAPASKPALPPSGATSTAGKPPTLHLALPAWMPDVRVEPGIDLIAAYAFRATVVRNGPYQWFHSFEVPRALATGEGFSGAGCRGARRRRGVFLQRGRAHRRGR